MKIPRTATCQRLVPLTSKIGKRHQTRFKCMAANKKRRYEITIGALPQEGTCRFVVESPNHREVPNAPPSCHWQCGRDEYAAQQQTCLSERDREADQDLDASHFSYHDTRPCLPQPPNPLAPYPTRCATSVICEVERA